MVAYVLLHPWRTAIKVAAYVVAVPTALGAAWGFVLGISPAIKVARGEYSYASAISSWSVIDAATVPFRAGIIGGIAGLALGLVSGVVVGITLGSWLQTRFWISSSLETNWRIIPNGRQELLTWALFLLAALSLEMVILFAASERLYVSIIVFSTILLVAILLAKILAIVVIRARTIALVFATITTLHDAVAVVVLGSSVAFLSLASPGLLFAFLWAIGRLVMEDWHLAP